VIAVRPARSTRLRVLVAVGLASVLGCLAAVEGGAVAAGSPSGCGAATESQSLSLRIGGRTRTVIVHVPSGYTGKKPVPLVLNMHGSGSTAGAQEAFTGMDATADAARFIVAYPQAAIPDRSGFDWNVPGVPLIGGKAVPAGAPDDIAFLTKVVAELEQRYCVARHRVYATGFSGGARMASQLACDASAVFAAVAPVSGLRFPAPCPAKPAVPVIAFHGTADPIDPYGGHRQPYWTYPVATAEVDWAHHDGCASSPAVSHPAPTVTLTAYGRCRDGSTVELYSVVGEGHEWPGGPPLPRAYVAVLGPQSTAVDADRLIWAFFDARQLR
jgi:polyhydroxybutyrate depolymerase